MRRNDGKDTRIGSSTVVDLFSGAGGMSWGFWSHRGDFRLVGAVDLEKGKPGLGKCKGTRLYCNQTYKRNLGIEPLNADIGSLDPTSYRESLGLKRGELTVLISCAPCTGFSQKKAQNHIEDDRQNQLVERSALFVEEFRPRFFVMENVKELIKGNHRHHFANLVATLESMGYGVFSGVYNFADYGLPQSRIRAIIIAEAGHIPPDPLRTAKRRTVRDAISKLPKLSAGQTLASDSMHTCPNHTAHTIERMRAIPHDGGSWCDIPDDQSHLLIPSMNRRRPGSFPDIYGRMWWDKPAITITRECGHPGNGRYTHPEQDRMLSVREMALLQGFPDDYVFEGPMNAKYNQIGDAVPPYISRKIAASIVSILSGNRPKELRQQEMFKGPSAIEMTTSRSEVWKS